MDSVIKLNDPASVASWSLEVMGMRWLKSPRLMCVVAR